MDQSILERLMIDEALGTLSPDVSALLAAHTNADERSKWNQIALLAKSAGKNDISTTLPALQHPRIPIHRILSIAAVLMVGIGLGLFVPKLSAPPPLTQLSPPPAQPIIAPPPNPTVTVGVPDFWSSQRLFAVAMSANHNNSSTFKLTPEGVVR